MTIAGRTVKARYTCPRCNAVGRWFPVEESRASEAVARRLAQHQERCAAVKGEGRAAA